MENVRLDWCGGGFLPVNQQAMVRRTIRRRVTGDRAWEGQNKRRRETPSALQACLVERPSALFYDEISIELLFWWDLWNAFACYYIIKFLGTSQCKSKVQLRWLRRGAGQRISRQKQIWCSQVVCIYDVKKVSRSAQWMLDVSSEELVRRRRRCGGLSFSLSRSSGRAP